MSLFGMRLGYFYNWRGGKVDMMHRKVGKGPARIQMARMALPADWMPPPLVPSVIPFPWHGG